MKTAKEILQKHIGDDVIFSAGGGIHILTYKGLNANDIVNAMDEYKKENPNPL